MLASPNPESELTESQYRYVKPLAKGGMGEVWIVEHRELGELRVMKVLRSDVQFAADLVGRLRAEARLLTRLVHPNLVRVLDFGRLHSNRAYLVSELLEGEPLSALIKREAPLPLALAVRLTGDVLRGLTVVHKAGIVHRDIKPDNLFVTTDGTLKILDFGVAKVLTAEAKQAAGTFDPTATAMVVGTPSYISPEQIRAEEIDARADLYGLGCVLYAMLTGAPPFVRKTQMDLLKAHILDAPAPVPGSSAMQAVLTRALAKLPQDRFASAEVMLAAVDAIEAAPAGPAASSAPKRIDRTVRMDAPIVEAHDEATDIGTRWEHVPGRDLEIAPQPEPPTLLISPPRAGKSRAASSVTKPTTRATTWMWLLGLALLILGGLIAVLVGLHVGWLG